MRPPWFEASAALAASGQARAATLARISLAAGRAPRPNFHNPLILVNPMADPSIDYALLRDPRHKPTVFLNLDALARHLLRARQGEALVFDPTPSTLVMPGEHTGRHFVRVEAEGQESGRRRFLGYAYVRNSERAREILQAAIARLEPARWAA